MTPCQLMFERWPIKTSSFSSLIRLTLPCSSNYLPAERCIAPGLVSTTGPLGFLVSLASTGSGLVHTPSTTASSTPNPSLKARPATAGSVRLVRGTPCIFAHQPYAAYLRGRL
jgi:hypothetical protein